MTKNILIMALALMVTPAWAVSKCTGLDGTVTYQEAACPSGTGAAAATKAVPQPAEKGVMTPQDVARSLDAQLVDAQQKKAEQKKALSGTNWDTVRQDMDGRKQNFEAVRAGMTAAQARGVLGDPDKVNRSRTATGESEQWIYRQGRNRSQYVYFRNDVVTTVQTTD